MAPRLRARTFSPVRRAAAFLFRFRDYLAPVLVVATLLSSRRDDFLADRVLDGWLVLAGVACVVGGLVIRLVVAGQVDIRRSGVDKRVAASRLVVAGLYAHARNPLYLANTTLVFGLTLVYGSRRAYATVLPIVVLGFLAIVMLEEEFLARKFGREYRRYCGRVCRFRPTFRGLATTMRDTPFDWRRALRREYGTLFAAISAAVALVAAKHVTLDGLDASSELLSRLMSVWAACCGTYLIVRRLKKTGRLETPVPAVFVPEFGGDVLR